MSVLHEVRWEPEHWPKAVARVVGQELHRDGGHALADLRIRVAIRDEHHAGLT